MKPTNIAQYVTSRLAYTRVGVVYQLTNLDEFMPSIAVSFVLGIVVVLIGGCALFNPTKAVINENGPLDATINGQVVHCDAAPPNFIARSNSADVQAAVSKVTQLASLTGKVTESVEVQKLAELSVGANDFLVIDRSLCVRWYNGSISKEQYDKAISEILPLLRASQTQKASSAEATTIEKRETELRFEAALDGHRSFFRNGDGTVRVGLLWHLKPVVQSNAEKATLLVGLATIHNDELIGTNVVPEETDKTCVEVKSCIKARAWNWAKKPIIIRGGDKQNETTLPWFADLPADVHRIRVYWILYQVEADNGNLCVIDASKKGPADGVPYLKVVTPEGKDVGGGCYYSSNVEVFEVQI